MMAVDASVLRGLPARVIAEATGAHPRTVERWRAGSRPRRTVYRARLDDLAAVLQILAEGVPPRARLTWLTSRSAHLGWRRPVAALASGEFDVVRGAALAYLSGDPV